MADRGAHDMRTVIGPSAYRARKRPLRRRLVVATPTAADAVRSVGGWMFDSVIAGSDVLVLAADSRDTRPLRILGARPGDLTAALRSPVHWPPPHVVVVDSGLYATEARVRRLTQRMLDNGLTEVWFCGQGWPVATGDDQGWRYHRLSVATVAFKAHALAAAAVPVDVVETSEAFYSGQRSVGASTSGPYVLPMSCHGSA